MVDIETDWAQFFPLTERNQIVTLLEELAIAAGGDTTDTVTLLQIQTLLQEAAGQVVTTPTIPSS